MSFGVCYQIGLQSAKGGETAAGIDPGRKQATLKTPTRDQAIPTVLNMFLRFLYSK